MKTITKQSRRKTAAYSAVVATKAGFTIVELLTVMSIIVILIGILVPALNASKRYAKTLAQRAQFKGIDDMLADFSSRDESTRGYPPSNALDPAIKPYCGAMKLAEAMVGLDMLGFHPDSAWRADGTINGNVATLLYGLPATPADVYQTNLRARWGPFLPIQSAYKLVHIYGITTPFSGNEVVLCDVYSNVTNLDTAAGARRKIGMPILYYRADPSGISHDSSNLPTPDDNKGNIYNYWDNQVLLGLGKPENPTFVHKLFAPLVFYENMRDHKIVLPSPPRPYRPDSYVLISAGYDGEYGTADDVFNFDWKAK
jgi:prepilin-type N-terminal cleavage/methylation domain-containing protein